MTQKQRRGAGESAPSAPSFDPVKLRYRRDGCTPERQFDFIRYLAECGCVIEACRRVGLSSEAVYELARRPDAQSFRLAWEIAMDNAVRRVGDNAFSRALNGVAIPHYYKGELVGEHRRWDERLTMFILRYRDPLRFGKHLDRAEFRGHVEEKALLLGEALEQVRIDAEREAAGLPREIVRDIPVANDDEDDREPWQAWEADDAGPDGDGEGPSPPDVPSTSSTSARAPNRAARRRAAARKRRR
jgi:hypothetical protein